VIRSRISGAFVALASTIAGQAHADELNFNALSSERPNIVTARVGMEGGIVGELGYRRVVGLLDTRAAFGLDLAAPLAEFDTSDYRARMVLAMPVAHGRNWKLIGALGPTLRSAGNPLNQTHAVGGDFRFTGGYYAPGWFAAGEIGAEFVGGAHIENSDLYKRYVHADAKDGWYRATGGTLYAGVHGGLSFSALDVVLRLGHHRGSSLEPKPMPFFATVGVNVPLP
jgi:hypothetical protein